jgi:protein tyrosine phosphatase
MLYGILCPCHLLVLLLVMIIVGPTVPLNLTEVGAIIESSEYDSNHPSVNAIDNTVSSCSLFTSSSKTWMRVSIPTLRYIKEVRILFNSSTSGERVFIGRSQASNGLNGNTNCRPLSKNGEGYHWENRTCYQPILGQIIYIEMMSTSMQICHIEVFYDEVLNIYSPVNITSSSQQRENGPVWCPVDGMKSTTNDLTWVSVASASSWWRMEFPMRRAISSVVIYPKTLSDDEKQNMIGFSVYVGDLPSGNGNSNAMCGKPWAGGDSDVIVVNCSTNLFGKYLYVAGAGVSSAVLYLSEISVYECQAPSALITSNVTTRTLFISQTESVNLTCQTSKVGCMSTEISWTGPDGSSISATSNRTVDDVIVSSITVKGNSFGGQYKCSVKNKFVSVTNYSDVLVLAVVSVTPIVSVNDGDVATLACEAKGYPMPNITWLKNDVAISHGVAIQSKMINHYGIKFTVGPLSLSDNGTVYTCEVKQEGGPVIREKSRLIVKPVAMFTSSPQSLVGIAGSNVTLSCEAQGQSVKLINWTVGDSKISSDSDYDISTESISNGLKSSLTIRKLKLSQGSQQTFCTAGTPDYPNLETSDRATIRVLGSITSFKNKAYYLGETSQDSFDCLFTANPMPQAVLQLDNVNTTAGPPVQTMKMNEFKITIPINSLTAKTSGIYQCVVEFSGSSLYLNGRAQLQVLPSVDLTPKPAIKITAPRKVVLTCSAVGFPLPHVTWSRRIGSTSFNVTHLSSSSFDYSSRVTKSQLTLDDASLAEAGDYSCVGNNMLKRNGLLITEESSSTSVQVSANISSHSLSVDAIWGTSVELFCNATGYPAPNLLWTFDGKPLTVNVTTSVTASSSSFGLTALHVNSHGGEYKCEATNAVGNTSALVKVTFQPRILVFPMSVGIVYGSRLELSCTVGSYPAIDDVVWYKDDQQITGSSVTVVSKNETTVTSRYSLQSATEAACGNYRCYNETSPSATVTVSSSAVLLLNRSSVVEGDALFFECRAVGCPRPFIAWQFRDTNSPSFETLKSRVDVYIESYQLNSFSSMSRLIISNTSRSQAGLYRCCSSNSSVSGKKGYSTKRKITVYYVSSFAVSSNVTVDEGQMFHLNCSPQGNPLLTEVSWMKIPFESDADAKPLPVRGGGRIMIWNDTDVVSLMVDKSFTSDTGFYQCQFPGVGNPVLSSRILVIIRGRPASVSESQVDVSAYATNITLSWAEPFDGFSIILNYLVSLRLNGSSNFTFVREVNATSGQNSVSIMELSPFTIYFARIVPFNKLGGAEDANEFKITTIVAAPSAPQNLTVTSTSSTSLFASWTEPEIFNGPIDVYNVYVQEKNDVENGITGKLLPPWKRVSITSTTIGELKKYTSYILVVKAANKNNNKELESPSSNTVVVQTLADAPSIPLNVVVVAIDDTRLQVTWDEPSAANGIIMYYQVLYVESSKFDVHNLTRNLTSSGQQLSVDIMGLTAYTSYTVAVRGFTISYGNLSQPSEGKTAQGLPSAPLTLVVVNTSSTSIELSWASPLYHRGVIEKYMIHYVGTKNYFDIQGMERTNMTEKNIFTADSSTLAFKIQGLWPDFNFTITVAAMTGKGVGDSSGAVEASTEVDAPLPPMSGQPLTQTTTTLTLELTKPSNRNGNIGSVLVLVAELKDGQSASNINFAMASTLPYSDRITAGIPYVAAQYNYVDFPSSFTLGDNAVIGGYDNAPLKPGTRYAYALRSISAANPLLYSTGEPAETKTRSESSGDSNIAAIAGAAAGAVVVVLAIVLACIVLRRRQGKTDEFIGSNQPIDGEIAMSDFVKPTVSAPETEIGSISGSVVVLKVKVTGHPRPKVEWKRGGKVLPGKDTRYDVIADGSLQISSLNQEDAGQYQCIVSNKVGTSQCHLKLRVVFQKKKEPISVANFEKHVEELHDNRDHGFSLEYLDLDTECVSDHSATAASLECNKVKNRYGNIVPYDHTRVILEELPNVSGSDYINASYINAYGRPMGYIACQGPNSATVEDFWRMIWQENVQTIVVVTNLEERGKSKCVQYWPSLTKNVQYGTIRVKFHEELLLAECCVRTFRLSNWEKDNETRIVTQFHFTGWPDHGVPSYATSLLNFQKRVQSHYNKLQTQGPMVVHCSAGVGRTGTFMVIDYNFQRIKQEGKIDIFNLITEFRMQRPHMVQTEAQYIFCHDAILEYLLCGDTSVSAPNLRMHIRQMSKTDPLTDQTGFDKQLQLLEKVSPNKRTFSYSGGRKRTNAAKNRYASSIPPDNSCIYLAPVVGETGDNSYINAATVDVRPHNICMFFIIWASSFALSKTWQIHCAQILSYHGKLAV